jgi:hypothetical protein
MKYKCNIDIMVLIFWNHEKETRIFVTVAEFANKNRETFDIICLGVTLTTAYVFLILIMYNPISYFVTMLCSRLSVTVHHCVSTEKQINVTCRLTMH